MGFKLINVSHINGFCGGTGAFIQGRQSAQVDFGPVAAIDSRPLRGSLSLTSHHG